ncbi:hypothetical protein EHO61_01580 [Leptospira fluminis]|uniref:Uncharacterized protein n=1 Tax=Leptospira fluminis TaxID=2484979 RepID=A0A4R9GT11_9LEPT|nr:hypothetical protein [Leptospira fluminis]TGK21952.1 hypothetical protein EHO61_01580 [Leptospira fluminis]
MRRTFSICFFLVICTIKSVLALNSTFSWEELLEQAAEEVRRGRYEQAMEKLAIADESGKPRDFRYYWVLGKVFQGRGENLEALRHFRTSLQMQPDQEGLLREMTDLYDELRIPDKALETARVLLTKRPEDRDLRYRALLWASRTGNLEYYKNALSLLESSHVYSSDEKAILQEIGNLQASKKNSEATDRCRKFLPYFPRNEDLHRICILAYKGKDQGSPEKSLIERALIFRENPIFHHILSMEYLDQKKYVDSCASARRSLLLALQSDRVPEKDYLIPIRRIYQQNGSVIDQLAVDILEEVIFKKRKLDPEEWESLLKQTRFNWEILAFALSDWKNRENSLRAETAENWRERYLSLRSAEREKDLSRFAGPYYLDRSFELYLENASSEK